MYKACLILVIKLIMSDNIAYTKTYHRKVDSLVVQTLQFCLANLGSNLDYVTILLFVI